MVAKMQTNALWGQVSKDLDELVHLTNLPFIAPDTSFPLSPKFRTPQIEAYDKSKDPLAWSHSKPSCTYKVLWTRSYAELSQLC